MAHLKLFTKKDINIRLNKRPKEIKFGQSVHLLSTDTNIYDSISKLDVTYVVLGIKEHIGVLANHGKSNTYNSWDTAINFLLNIQNNDYNRADKVLILGCLEFPELYNQVEILEGRSKKSLKKLRELTSQIDKIVCHTIFKIVKAGKIPIVIGGGHNNSYGMIKGSSLALNKPLNVINFDAHADFRIEEGRHSGNGFSYAFGEGFLNNYFVFGIHENYNSQNMLKALNKLKQVKFATFEQIDIRQETSFEAEMKRAETHVSQSYFGIEIDCDAIQSIQSSAMSPNGFSTTQARRFVNHFAKLNKAKYLHICEASPDETDSKRVGKLLTFLITDFLRAHSA